MKSKIDKFKAWAGQKRIYSTADVKRYGNEQYFTSADVRARIDLIRDGFHRRIPNDEAKRRGLVKPGNAAIAWYEVIDGENAPELTVDERSQYAFIHGF